MRHLDLFIGGFTFLAMLVIGIVFEEERTTFVDIAFHLFEQARTGEVAVQNHRFVSALTQYLPTKMLAAGAPMARVQLVYSLSFPLYYGCIWAFTAFVLRSRVWALAWALTWLTFATHTHYWIQSELPQGLAVLTVALALIGCRPQRKWASVLVQAGLPLLLLTVAFAHPLLIVPVTASFGLLWLVDKPKRGAVLAAALTYYGAYWIRATFFSTGYDDAAGVGAGEVVRGIFAGNIPYAIPHLAANMISTYYAFAAIALIALLALWGARQRLAALWIGAAIGGHLLLVAVSYPGPTVTDFYIENLYLPAGFMAAAALAVAWKACNYPQLTMRLGIAVMVLASLRLAHVYAQGSSLYAPRLAYLQEQLLHYRGQDVAIQETPKLTQRLIMTWGTPYEAWVQSSRYGRPLQAYLVHPAIEHYRSALEANNNVIFTFHQVPRAELPAHYAQAVKPLNYRLFKLKE